jgi:hypothetical protein
MVAMSKFHNGHGAALPMSAPGLAGTPCAYRGLFWALHCLDKAREALACIREGSGEFYPLDPTHDGNPAGLANKGLFVVAARELARAARFLAEACGELDFTTLATLRADTAPPPLPKNDRHYGCFGECLPVAESALDRGCGRDDLELDWLNRLDDRSAVACLSELVRACRVAAAALVESGYIDADREIVETAVSRLEGGCA